MKVKKSILSPSDLGTNYLWEKGITQETPIIVGVSWWVDSMSLLHRLSQIHPNQAIIAVHINHLLRWEESDLDEALVRKTCKDLWIHVEVLRKNIQEEAIIQKSSLEATGRIFRRKFFEEMLEKYQAKRIFLAHHLWDQAETILLNLTRGSRIRGLSGMSEDDGKYVRPFLQVEKNSIISYALAYGIIWNEDSSNTSPLFQRNILRNDIIPLLKGINGEVEKTLGELGEYMKTLEWFFDTLLEEILVKNSITEESFSHLPELLQDMCIERIFRKAHGGSTIGLSSGNIAEIRRFILDARGGTEKIIGWLHLTKEKRIISWR